MADFGDQKNFNESLRLTNNEVHVNTNWTEETLKTISNFIKCSSSKADILLDCDDDDWYIIESEKFVQFLSDCLDGISSIRLPNAFGENSFWRMCGLFEEYKIVKGDNSLPHLISLFAPFPNKVPLSFIHDEDDLPYFSFLSQCHPDKVAVPQHKEAYQDLRRCVLNSLLETVRAKWIRYTLYYKCLADFGDQNDFHESLRLTNNEVHVNPNWTEETLKTISNFIKCSSSKVDIIIDDDDDGDISGSESKRFVQCLSDYLDGISSIRLLDGFNDYSFWRMCDLFKEYNRVKRDNSLPQLISLFAPFPNKVTLSFIHDEDDLLYFSFLSQCHPDKVAVPQHKEAYQDLRRCVLNSLLETVREKRISYILHYKCMADFGDQKDFNESLRLTNNEVHVNPNWTEETLKTISNFIKCSSSKVDIIVDDDDHWGISGSESKRFVQFLSDCLDGISSIRCNEDVLLTCSKVLYTGGQRQAKLLLKKLGQKIEIEWTCLKNSSCKYLGKLMSLCRRDLSLTLTPKAITLRGLLLLCKSWTHLQTLRITDVTARLISKLIRTKRKNTSVSVKEMVILKGWWQSTIKVPHLISNLSIILRHWSISQLDLSSCDLEGHFVTNLLTLQGHISLKLSKKTLQDLVFIIYEAQDVPLLKSFLKKVGYDLSSCKLNWNVLHFLFSHSDERIKTNLRRSDLQERNLMELLPWLHRVHPSGMNGRLSKMLLKVIFDSGSVELIDLWLQLSDHRVNFNNMELGSSHCDALRLITEHSCHVRLSLLWTSFTDETAEKLLSMMGRVSELSLDRNTLLKFLHKLIEVNQPETAQHFTKALRCTLDFSSSSKIDISSDDTSHLLKLSFTDCQVISKSVGLLKDKIELNINDCEIEDGGLEVLFDIFDKVHLRTSKELLLRFISMTDENNTSRIISLGRAIGSTIDLSGTSLSADTCRSLAIVINYIEEDCEVDLSKCSLSTECIERLSACLHKIQDLDVSNNNLNDEATEILASTLSQGDSLHVIDLSSNNITDAGAAKIHNALNGKSNLKVVRIYNNKISNRAIFGKDPHYEI
ncbi:uncharacterized protein LOC114669445 isoform X2 [Erpetoichthys calabaricus]|uniref:uncharacterized protein LOC114669445 isoform X2 n=1 Tax=Erpetoichthys calabaricus TaxID=27687 RepID=UPI0022343322|nr:uncharacterized protein LOC114669445 isoform X2 [Erpetoichthys calabaricus]